jgi:hypothetical protein
MKHVTLEDGTVARIEFEHYQDAPIQYNVRTQVSYSHGGTGERVSICTIRDVNKMKPLVEGEKDNSILAVGVSHCHANDCFSKETGRVKSLTNALQDVFSLAQSTSRSTC